MVKSEFYYDFPLMVSEIGWHHVVLTFGNVGVDSIHVVWSASDPCYTDFESITSLGVFFSLVCLCIYILRTRRRSNYMHHLGAVLLLFTLDTIHMVLSYVIQFRSDPNSPQAEVDRAYLNFNIASDQPRPTPLLAFHRVVFISLRYVYPKPLIDAILTF